MGLSSSTTNRLINQLLNFTYDKVKDGFLKFDSAQQIVDDLKKSTVSDEELIQKIIRKHRFSALGAGFVTGMPGLAFLPITLPSNILGLLFIQMRLACSIAIACGNDLDDQKTRELIFLCIAGNSASSVLNGVGNSLSTYFINKTAQTINTKMTQSVSQKVIEKGVKKVSKKKNRLMPVISGAVNSFYDLLSTNQVAMTAKETFFRNN